jgi:hypothetical protein
MRRYAAWGLIVAVLLGSAPAWASTVLSTGTGGTVPTEASDVYGAWDQILIAMLPLAVLGAAIGLILLSLSGRGMGLVGSIVVAIISVIGAMALPGIITGSGSASAFGGLVDASRSIDPTYPLIYTAVMAWRNGRR